MASSKRILRSAVASQLENTQPAPTSSPVLFVKTSTSSNVPVIQIIREGSKLPGLSPSDLKLLRDKQDRLRSTASATRASLPASDHIRNALESTLIFAQYEAGTAVCIDAEGWILTCAHCSGDDEEEYEAGDKRKWLLFYTGLAVQVECRFWDAQRDLALLKVIAVETNNCTAKERPLFGSIPQSLSKLSKDMPIFCIGQPGRDDLESTSDKRTKYNLFEVSEGNFCGMMVGKDPQDNSEIGTMMHDAWTYWGHSGAPLVRATDGTLVGLHSSWDDQTAMRHGIPAIAISAFLQQNLTMTVL